MARKMSVGEQAIAGLKQALAHARGEHVPGLVVHYAVDVPAIRKRTGLSQEKFAAKFGLDVSAVRDWEQGRRSPDRAAKVLLRVIDQEPEAVTRANRAVAEPPASAFRTKPAAPAKKGRKRTAR